jgi:RNA polymerase sigma-70 factor (ECF subfamily)
MGELLAHYWRPMLIHLRYKGLNNESAEDVLQDFMVELLDQDLLTVADPQKGKFRSLLLTALDRFHISRRRRQQAAKRSPGTIASLDAGESDITQAADTSASIAFERAWALDVLAEALARLERECTAAADVARWQIFQERIVFPLLGDAPETDYSVLARRFGLEHAKAAMNVLVTAKRQFARVLRDVIREYVTRAPGAAKRLAPVAPAASTTITGAIAGIDLQEHQTRQAIERELSELQQVLAGSRSVADIVVQLHDGDPEDELKSRHWRLLTEHADESESWSTLFATGSEVDEDSLSAGCDDLLRRPLSEVPECSGAETATVGELLRGASPPVTELLALKNWFNVQRFSPTRDVPAPLANGLYLLVLAVALVKCGQRITGLADPQFRAGLEWLAAQPWIAEDLRSLTLVAHAALPA